MAYLKDCYAVTSSISTGQRKDPIQYTAELETHLLQNQPDEALKFFYPDLLLKYIQDRENGNCPNP